MLVNIKGAMFSSMEKLGQPGIAENSKAVAYKNGLYIAKFAAMIAAYAGISKVRPGAEPGLVVFNWPFRGQSYPTPVWISSFGQPRYSENARGFPGPMSPVSKPGRTGREIPASDLPRLAP